MNTPLADDGLYLPVGWALPAYRRYQVFRESLLVALGITVGGKWMLLAVSLGGWESSASWKVFY